MTRLVVTCLSRTLNAKLDERQSARGDDTFTLRNVGGSVKHLEYSIKEIMRREGITRLKVVTHKDCRVMGIVWGMCRSQEGVNPRVSNRLVRDYGRKFESREVLERYHLSLQREWLKDFKEHENLYGVESKMVHVPSGYIAKGHKHETLVIGMGSRYRYYDIAKTLKTDLRQTYFIQGNFIEEILPDIEITIKGLRIKDVRLIAADRSEGAIVENFRKQILSKNILIRKEWELPVTILG